MFIETVKNYSNTVESYMMKESDLGINQVSFYDSFTKKIGQLKSDLIVMLEDLKSQGKTIVGYGAAAKGNTFMSYIGIDDKYLDYIADLSQYKQGLFFSGNHLPIVSPDKLVEDIPDYVLILAWNFSKEIIRQPSYITRISLLEILVVSLSSGKKRKNFPVSLSIIFKP